MELGLGKLVILWYWDYQAKEERFLECFTYWEAFKEMNRQKWPIRLEVV